MKDVGGGGCHTCKLFFFFFPSGTGSREGKRLSEMEGFA